MAILTDPAPKPRSRIDLANYDGTAVLHVQGELVSATTPQLRADLTGVVGRRRVLLELSGVSFMDATGLGALIGGIRRIQEGHGLVALCGARPSIAAVLRTVGVGHLVHVADSAPEALAWLDSQGPEAGLARFGP